MTALDNVELQAVPARRVDVWTRPRFLGAFAAAVALGLLAPALLGPFGVLVAAEALIFGLFALSYDLLVGRAGLVSFGHAAFFGGGGYAAAVSLMYLGASMWLGLLLAVVLSVVLAVIVGVVSIRTTGIYFSILTLAFAEVLYRFVFHFEHLGGSDGLIGLKRPPLSLFGFQLSLESNVTYYYFVLALLVLVLAAVVLVVRSPFGHALVAMRENEGRLPFLGFNTKLLKITVFCMSAGIAGLAGGLYAIFKGFAAPEQLFFIISGEVIVMALIGGMGTLLGAVLGGVILTVFTEIVSGWTESYNIFVGILFIFVVIFKSDGLFGFLGERKRP
ncbi:MAG: branched-chain amino acid ABC transporter permease [Candidatus Lambdaproteobacteria bacterium]|nr:branched-chain amino acid ABC transporter permease [Candidatus Lambdaproteobacteria bacterium]